MERRRKKNVSEGFQKKKKINLSFMAGIVSCEQRLQEGIFSLHSAYFRSTGVPANDTGFKRQVYERA